MAFKWHMHWGPFASGDDQTLDDDIAAGDEHHTPRVLTIEGGAARIFGAHGDVATNGEGGRVRVIAILQLEHGLAPRQSVGEVGAAIRRRQVLALHGERRRRERPAHGGMDGVGEPRARLGHRCDSPNHPNRKEDGSDGDGSARKSKAAAKRRASSALRRPALARRRPGATSCTVLHFHACVFFAEQAAHASQKYTRCVPTTYSGSETVEHRASPDIIIIIIIIKTRPQEA